MACAQDKTVIDGISYGVAEWDEGLGNHRALIRIAQAAAVVRVRVPWRRRDRDVQKKRLVVVNLGSGKPVANLARIRLERDSADLAFGPVTAGTHAVYYLPFKVQPGWGGYYGDYLPPEDAPAPAWLKAHRLDGPELASGAWRSLQQGRCTEIQARGEFNRLDPMAVPATTGELSDFLGGHDASYLVFPEDRRRPIRMRDQLPHRWVRNGPSSSFAGQAQRNEFYAFQIGVFAARQDVQRLAVSFGTLSAGANRIPADRLTCFNTQGSDWLGRPMAPEISIAKGMTQALWIGIDISAESEPGEYRGTVTLTPANAAPTTVEIRLAVSDPVLPDRGDADAWRHSRLRWLDSDLGRDADCTQSFEPLRVEGRTVSCLQRRVRLADTGLPESITSQGNELLLQPLRFVVDDGAAHAFLAAPDWSVRQIGSGLVRWQTKGRAGPLRVVCTSTMESDGYINVSLACRADRDTSLRDLRLEIPMRPTMATYLMGIGREGGRRPERYEWRWPAGPANGHYYDSFWMGDAHGGIHCELRGADYCGPMVNLYWRLGQLSPPETWANGGKGGCRVADVEGAATATSFSGARNLAQGEEVTFEFSLIVTPVKPLDSGRHFRERYYHSHGPPEQVRAAGGNIVNVHHGSAANPYINYPFLAADALREYVAKMHAADLKVKIYYTVRELTNHIPEIWALRSLGHEVLAGGRGGGYPWLREQLVDDYSPSWYQHFAATGDACASIVNSGASRWYNYHIEGLRWLLANTRMDGLYLDDVSYDRETLKRIRKVLDRKRPGSMIDLHSNTAFSIGPANQYMEFLPYIDRLWFGEGFDYDKGPDFWLIEISGIPFGLMGDMLQNGGNRWRGMLYGMTARAPWCAPTNHVWRVWDSFGIDRARMVGYWEKDCPVRTDHSKVLATAYIRPGKALVAVATWHPRPVAVQLDIDWEQLGIDGSKATLFAPAIADYQAATLFRPSDAIPIMPGRGWLLQIDTAPHAAPPHRDPGDEGIAGRSVRYEERFSAVPLRKGWQKTLSPVPGGKMAPATAGLQITTKAHSCAFIKRKLAPGATVVRIVANAGDDGGMTWGVGLGLAWPGRFLRFNLRAVEGRVGIDDGKSQLLHQALIRPNRDYHLGIRLEADTVVFELSEDGQLWWPVKTLPRHEFPGSPTHVQIGKMAPAGGTEQADALPNPVANCLVKAVRVYGKAP